MPMRRNILFMGLLLLTIIVATILLIFSILSGPTNGHKTLYDNTSINGGFRGNNATLEMLYAPLNVSKLAYPFPYEMRKSPMSVEEAADCVRSFVKDPSMDVTYAGNGSTFFGIVYEMRSGQSFFSVNPMTGQVFMASSNDSPGPNVSISIDEARSIAAGYVRAHYKGFNSMKGMVLTDSVLEDHDPGGKGYTFRWHEYVDSVQTLNNVNVIVDADSGKVLFYSGLDLPVPVLLYHTISREQAAAIAISSLGNYSADDLRAYLADNRTFSMTFLAEPAFGDGVFNATITNITASQQFVLDGNFTQHQAWNVIIDETRPMIIHDVDGDHSTEDGHRWWINVDAGTGDVISIDRCL